MPDSTQSSIPNNTQSPGRAIAAKLGAVWNSDVPLLMPEVWDVASARLLEVANYPVLTTSASAYAWAHGYRPSERVGLEELLIVAGRIARDCKTPLIADLEGCFDRSNQLIRKGVAAALTIGCSGAVIGDGGRDGLQQMLGIMEVANRIKSCRIAELESRRNLFLVARTDSFHLANILQRPFEEAVNRANSYLNAGADLVQISGVQNIEVVAELVKHVNGPIAITISHDGAPNIAVYRDLGVAAISLGTGLMRSALTQLGLTATNLLETGEFTHLRGTVSDNELSETFSPEKRNLPPPLVATS